MKQPILKKSEGFTIIEVLIVLAIAGLIMLIVFLAVPALQRTSKNNQRRSDASHLAGLVNEHMSNNNGKIPTGIGTAAGQLDLTGENFSSMNPPTNITSGTGTLGTTDQLQINTGTTCVNNTVTAGGGSRSFSISFQVAKNGGGVVNQCV